MNERPRELIIMAPLSASSTTWWALESKWRRRIAERPVECPSKSKLALEDLRKELLAANAMGVRTWMWGILLPMSLP